MSVSSFWHAAVWAMFLPVVGFFPTRADEAVRLSERFPVGYQYQVRTRVQLSGSLAVPGEKGKPAPKPVPITGESAIDYDERVLALDRDGRVGRTVRIFRRIDVERQLGDTTQKTGLRPSVRRVVMLRLNNREVPFSPNGPLTWGEIDLLRTDVFTPALVGLLPDGPIRVGDRWQASTLSVQELTDLEKIDGGTLTCRLERVERAGSVSDRSRRTPPLRQPGGGFAAPRGAGGDDRRRPYQSRHGPDRSPRPRRLQGPGAATGRIEQVRRRRGRRPRPPGAHAPCDRERGLRPRQSPRPFLGLR